MEPMFQVIAQFCCGTFFGVALYITLVQQPAAEATGIEFAEKFFPPMYYRAAPIQIVLAMLGGMAGLGQWLLGGSLLWLIGAICLLLVIPFTLLVIKPINDTLISLQKSPDPHIEETTRLLKRWAQLHGLRSLASGVAFMLFLLAPFSDLMAV